MLHARQTILPRVSRCAPLPLKAPWKNSQWIFHPSVMCSAQTATSTPAMGLRHELAPGESVPRGKIYPLSIPEQKAMEEYIEEALRQGYIRPSTSPAASSFFFVAKIGGGLRPLHWLSDTQQDHGKVPVYPLPLVPAALETPPRSTCVHQVGPPPALTNLVRIREGDEWKTAFVTPTGHYEYCVMRMDLSTPPPYSGFHSRCSGSFSISSYSFISMIYSSTPGVWPNIAIMLRRSYNAWGNTICFLKQRSAPFHQTSVKFLGYNIDQKWHPDGRGEGNCHQRLAHTHLCERTPTLPRFLKLLSKIHPKTIAPFSQPAYQPAQEQAQITVLGHHLPQKPSTP